MPLSSLVDAYRRTGADLPWGDPRRAHGVAMEGYYWRITDAAAGRVVVAICGLCRGWAMVALAGHPGGFVRVATVTGATGDPRALGVRAGAALRASEDELFVDLGPDARLGVRLRARVGWPRRAWGALGPAQAVPGLGQYWHPHLLSAAVEGEARLGGAPVALTGATAYAEKNWGSQFAPTWWWGQAHGFAEPDACVAFAGGPLRLAAWRWAPSAVVIRLGAEVLALRPPLARTSAHVAGRSWRVRARSPRVEVTVEGDAESGARLPVPLPERPGALDWRSHHALGGDLRVELRRGGRLRWRGESALAGLERGGSQAG